LTKLISSPTIIELEPKGEQVSDNYIEDVEESEDM